MKTIVVLSDTHGNRADISKISNIILESDYVFHLGDCYGDFVDYAYALKGKAFQVHGNCDYGTSETDTEIITEIEGVKIFATHGHNYGVKQTKERLLRRAKEIGATLVFYGHTHMAEISEEDGVTFVNPGCMTKYSPKKSFAYVVINNGKVVATVNDKMF